MTYLTNDIPFYHFPKKPDELPFIIFKIDTAKSTLWDSEPDRHTFFMLFWITKGHGVHHIDFKGYPISPNSLYLLRPGQTHFFEVDTPLEGYIIQFKDDLLQLNDNPQMTNTGLDLFHLVSRTPVYYLSAPQSSKIQAIFHELFAEYAQEKFGQLQAIQYLMHLLFIQLRRYHQVSQTYNFPLTADLLTAQFQQLVDDHFATIRQLHQYAELLGVTAGHLSTSVKGVLGMPASFFIQQRIITEAKRLLVYTQLTTVEISHTLGFKDTSYFCRYFKRETDLSPLTFRSSYREKYHTHPAKSLQY